MVIFLLLFMLALTTSLSTTSLRVTPFLSRSLVNFSSNTLSRSTTSTTNIFSSIRSFKMSSTSSAPSPLDTLSPPSNPQDLINNAEFVNNQMKETALKCGRNPEDLRLVLVSKTKSVEDIKVLYDAGYRDFGENYSQELLAKAPLLPKDIHWHFIGHLQSGKANKLISSLGNSLHIIQTIDSIKLATKLNTAIESLSLSSNYKLGVYIQVDTSNEDTKSGVNPLINDNNSELVNLARYIITSCSSLTLCGLMTIGAPNDTNCFDILKDTRDKLLPYLINNNNFNGKLRLSMGMSGDYQQAIEKGADDVRVGSLIFGPRIYPKKD